MAEIFSVCVSSCEADGPKTYITKIFSQLGFHNSGCSPASPGPTKPEMELMLVSISTGVVSLASLPDLGFTVFSGKAGVSSGQAG